MKILVIADEDSFTQTLTSERADVLISCGDMADQVILQIAQATQCSRIFAVKGNHDGAGPFPAPILDLHLRTEAFGGLTFGGFRGSWRYKPRGHFLYDEDEVAELVAAFPPVDVFVAHNSPRHVHDREDEVHLGFEAFVTYIHRVQPRFFLHGHQHTTQETRIGETRIIGVYGQQRLEIEAAGAHRRVPLTTSISPHCTATMSSTQENNLLWWVIPGVLAGMPMPFIHPERRMAGGGALTAFEDELSVLQSAGVRAVVSLLNIPRDASVYESAGFSFLCLPVPDGGAPTFEQAEEFVRFVKGERATQRPVAVHCEAGLGRTGTLIAAYLIAQGESAVAAIEQVRAVERVAVETPQQIRFLEQYAERVRTNAG